MKKEVVTIRLDFLQGPIWISDVDTGQPMTGIDVIDNDEIVTSINHEISLLYSSFYEFDSNGEPCTFNSQKENTYKQSKGEYTNQKTFQATMNSILWLTQRG